MSDIRFYEINGEILTKIINPTGGLKDWLISNGLNPNKYSVLDSPVGVLRYCINNKDSMIKGSIWSKNIKPDSYDISDIDIEELECCSSIIFIFKNPFDSDSELRITPIVDSDSVVRFSRYKKLRRVLCQLN